MGKNIEIENKKTLVVKSNKIIEARYNFDIWELRVFAKMITMIEPNDVEFKKYRIPIKELMEYFGKEDKGLYERVRMIPERLMEKKIHMDVIDEEGSEVEFIAPLIVGAKKSKKFDEKAYIELQFHPDLKSELLQLKSHFTRYDIRNLYDLQSPHSVRVYELLKQYENTRKKSREFDLYDLKSKLGLTDKYPRYSNFKQRIILKAQKDLNNHTDISFTFEEKKKGRKVDKITFFIHSKEAKYQEIIPHIIVSAELEAKLKQLNLSSSVVEQVINSKGEDYFKWLLTNKKREIESAKNKNGWVLEAVKKGFFEKEYEKHLKVKGRKEKAILKKEKEQTNKRVVEQKKNLQFEENRKKVFTYLEQLSDEELKKLQQEILQSQKSKLFNEQIIRFFEKREKKGMGVYAVVNYVMKEKIS